MNPWETIALEDYESHMQLEDVKQLQTLNSIMKGQFEDYDYVNTVMILGVAGGNGLEHLQGHKFSKVYGVDVNADYLKAVENRYNNEKLECLNLDLLSEADKLPQADLVIANLFIEYVGYDAFTKALQIVNPKHVSCAIQLNLEDTNWVSDSPYIHSFDCLDEVHHQIDAAGVQQAMAGYEMAMHDIYKLPNGKALERIDFKGR